MVLTTYGTLASEGSTHSNNNSDSSGSGSGRGAVEGLFAVHWTRVILDEAHTIKNKVSHSHSTPAGLWTIGVAVS